MMSTPSSSARLPPIFPQVIASVVKFRCLYTHDLRRKSKRWHDGYLRFHKFNKRVMVYDDQGNFIGDHHWRSPDDVQDGDEMELDKGVLIEVTENMGTTETDITTIYEKKKSSQGSPQARDLVSQVPRTSTSVSASAPLLSSQSFRSLNDLLGIKRTPVGHLMSPYEQRNPPQPTSSPQEPERAPKRQRTASVMNHSRAQGEVVDLTDSTDSPQGPSMRQRPRGNLRVEQPSMNRENQSRAISRPIPLQKSDPPTVSRSSFPIAPKRSSADGSAPQAPVRAVNNYVKPIEPADNEASTNIPPPVNVPPTANAPPSTNIPTPSRPSSALNSGAPTAVLRMGTAKPRRKLMYSALLPGASRTPSPAASDTPPGSATRGTVTNTPEQQLTAAPDNSANEEFVPSTSTQFVFDEMTDGSGFKSPSTIKRLTGKRSLDSPLRKSISDPTALTARQAPAEGSPNAANKENEPKEQGPWTSEALDLFDFWPAGRPKPNE
ncbi:hypothetical protein E8E15_007906 [Penicillium rubens]|nr:hypothetical protein E8E15_007906 [Penicillium rubens]